MLHSWMMSKTLKWKKKMFSSYVNYVEPVFFCIHLFSGFPFYFFVTSNIFILQSLNSFPLKQLQNLCSFFRASKTSNKISMCKSRKYTKENSSNVYLLFHFLTLSISTHVSINKTGQTHLNYYIKLCMHSLKASIAYINIKCWYTKHMCYIKLDHWWCDQ